VGGDQMGAGAGLKLVAERRTNGPVYFTATLGGRVEDAPGQN